MRNGAPFKDWDLPAALIQVRAKLKPTPTATASSSRYWARFSTMGSPLSRPPAPRRWRRGSPAADRDSDRAGASAATRCDAQHHHPRRASPEDRTRGRLWPLRPHKEHRLMERHKILEAMGELKLRQRASFDEIAGKGLARRDELYPLIAQPGPRRAHPPTSSLDQLSDRRREVSGPQGHRQVCLLGYAGDEGQVRELASALSSTPNATRSSSAAPGQFTNAHLAMSLRSPKAVLVDLAGLRRPPRCAPSSPVGRADDLGASKIGRFG